MKKLLIFLLCSTILFGDSSGPTSGTATGGGWTTPSNVGASDNSYATQSLPGDTVDTGGPGISSPLSISSLGFSVPASATVLGITAAFERHCSGASSCSTRTDHSGAIKLTKTAGVAQGDNKGSTTSWGIADSTETLGSATDLWGSTWTVSEVNASGFGLIVVVVNSSTSGTRTANIDYMALTVTYTPSGSGSHRRVIISQTRTINLSQQGM